MTFAEQIAARTIWQEARGEGEEGQRAVAHVIVNRLRSGRWGRTLVSVCWADRQFSGWNNTDPNRVPAGELAEDNPALLRFCDFIRGALAGGADPTNNSTHYFNPKIVSPPWAEGKEFVQIGNHRFLRDVK